MKMQKRTNIHFLLEFIVLLIMQASWKTLKSKALKASNNNIIS